MDDNDIPSERVIHQPPSCIEFCPINPSIFIVGTYKLEDSQESSSTEGTTSQSRSGRVEVYQIRKRALSSTFGVSQCIAKYDFPDCAVLDLHFCLHDPTFLAVCTSTSQMVLFRLENVERQPRGRSIEPSILKVGSFSIGEDDTILATSFIWDPQSITADPNDMSFAVTFSSGEVKVLGVRQDMRSSSHCDSQILFQASIDPAHTLEAWTVAFADLSSSAENRRKLLTGGDDSVLAFHSITVELDSGQSRATQLFQDRKSHAAGVTAILPILGVSHLLPKASAFVTGSYDEHIRVFTIEDATPHKRKVVAELPLGGGVWRLRKLAESLGEEAQGVMICSVLILASCMHAGVRIVRIVRRTSKNMSRDWCSWEIDVVGVFIKGHESMCYGADSVDVRRLIRDDDEDHAAKGPSSSGQRSGNPCSDHGPPRTFVVVSTSFYDKKICVWNFHNEVAAVEQANTER